MLTTCMWRVYICSRHISNACSERRSVRGGGGAYAQRRLRRRWQHDAAAPVAVVRGGGGGALVEPAALAALLSAGGYGYDLRRTIMERTDGEVDVDVGGLYRVAAAARGRGCGSSRVGATTKRDRAAASTR